jgi:hypothetical protein
MGNMQNYDNDTTIPSDNTEAIARFRYDNDSEYRKRVNYLIWANKVDKPLQDSSLDMLTPLGAVTRGLGRIIPKENLLTTVYHGTSPASKQQILDNGISASFTGQDGTLTDKALSGTTAGDASKGLVFTTESKWDAARYAASHDPKTGDRVDNTSPIYDQFLKLGRQIKSYVANDGIIKMNLPGHMTTNEVLNPEFRSLLELNKAGASVPEKYQYIQNMPGLISNNVATTYGNIGFGSDRVFANNIPTKYIVGSKDYNPYSTGLGTIDANTIDYLTQKYGSLDLAQRVINNEKAIGIVKRGVYHHTLSTQQDNN